MATPARVMQSRIPYAVDRRERAIETFRQTRRRRRARGAVDTAVDAVMATGGLIVANATLHLNMGLPAGRTGYGLGGILLATGLAWITRTFRVSSDPSDPAASVARPVYLMTHAEGQRTAA